MIFLCTDNNLILSALNNKNGSEYIREHIKLYLESYGTEYDFQEYFLQKDPKSSKITAVVLRYNDQIYASISMDADLSELSMFLCGFSRSVIIADRSLMANFPEREVCYVMCKSGVSIAESVSNIRMSNDHKTLADLVCKSLSVSENIDYYLNLSHQSRHGLALAYAYYVNDEPVSAVVISHISENIPIITTVYTQEHFRGNGYAKLILDHVCCDSSNKYLLLCEEHNFKFYEKCGFSVADTCIRIRL